MTDRPLRVAVAAETITFSGAGLSYFVVEAVRRLAGNEPEFSFRVVTSSSYSDLVRLELPNVEITTWDSRKPQRYCTALLRRLGFADPVSTAYTLGSLLPARSLRSRWGNLEAIWGGMADVDAIWVPHYAINSERLSLARNLKRTTAPVLFTIHDVHPSFFPEEWSEESLARYENGFMPFARSSSLVVTHSEFQAEAIREHLAVAPENIAVTSCPPLLDPGVFEGSATGAGTGRAPAPRRTPARFGLFPASSTVAHKNHIRLLLAWRVLVDRMGAGCPRLVCTGMQPNWASVKALVEALELSGYVSFTGIVGTAELVSLYRESDFVIVPSLFEGGGSSPVAEAILAGKPVICSDIPQIRQQVESYGCAVGYFDPESTEEIAGAVERSLESMDVLVREAAGNREILAPRVGEMWDEWARFYSSKIRQIVEQRGRGGGPA